MNWSPGLDRETENACPCPLGASRKLNPSIDSHGETKHFGAAN